MLDLKKWWFAVKIALQIKINDTAPTNGYTGLPKWLRDAGASKILTGSIHLTVTEKQGFHLLLPSLFLKYLNTLIVYWIYSLTFGPLLE